MSINSHANRYTSKIWGYLQLVLPNGCRTLFAEPFWVGTTRCQSSNVKSSALSNTFGSHSCTFIRHSFSLAVLLWWNWVVKGARVTCLAPRYRNEALLSLQGRPLPVLKRESTLNNLTSLQVWRPNFIRHFEFRIAISSHEFVEYKSRFSLSLGKIVSHL